MISGIETLGDFSITSASTQVGEWVKYFDGVTAINVQFRLAYGSGGTAVRAYLQTSLDQGTTPIDLACVLFAGASEVKVLNLSGLTPKLTQVEPTDSALADDTAIDGILGDRFRIKLISSGLYAGSTVLSVRVHPR